MGRSVRLTGLLLGLGTVAVLVLSWRVPHGHPPPGASLSLTVNRTGELDVQPAGRLLHLHNLLPGGPAGAPVTRFQTRNTTGSPIVVHLRAYTPGHDLDSQLAVRIDEGPRRLFSGTLGALRHADPRLPLAPGRQTTLVFRAWLPPALAHAYRARDVALSLNLLTTRERPVACARC